VGKVDAINRGVQEAKNEIILCFDADAFLEKSAIQNMVMAFYDIRVGAVSGVCLVKNNNSVLNIFQSVEYYYVSLVRRAFSEVFGIGIWFFGAVIGFRKTVYEEVGGFKKDTLAEDNKFCLDVFSKGYKVVTVHNAIAHTPVPESISGLFKQRMRWYVGALQCVSQSVSNVSKKNIFYAFFLVFSQFFWGFYALISVPLVTYQFLYWLPSFANPILVLDYFFRWMSFYGAIFTIYMAQQWGLTLFELLGCVIGAITFIVIMLAFHLFRARFSIRKLLALFFYFPYAILLNTILAISLIKFFFTKKGEHFRK
jgi:cellulose synthase/poly-beta-1,6-N-acetylglucosamine synthase-like glycosyltransferase